MCEPPLLPLQGYDTYIRIFYALVGVLYAVLAAVGGLTVAMRRQEHSKWLKRFAKLLQLFTDMCFGVLYVAIFDYMVFLFDCECFGGWRLQRKNQTKGYGRGCGCG